MPGAESHTPDAPEPVEELRDSVRMREKFAVYDQGYRDGYADSRYHLLLYATGFVLGAMIARSIYKSMEGQS